jgi:OmpA-OmpF porin, OOP family
MRRIQYCRLTSVLVAGFALMFASAGHAQGTSKSAQTQVNTVQVSSGQKMDIEGVIFAQQTDSLMVRSSGGGIYSVTLANGLEIKEKKSNPFRGAKRYLIADLVPGLHVQVKGTGNSSGSVVAREIRLTQDDYKVAQTMDTRVVPVENRLTETQSRLGETEQNALRLSGQVQELSATSNAARAGAKAAQKSADSAMSAATDARSRANSAKAGVQSANERITSLDDYAIKNTATVHFKVGSAVLSRDEKSELEKIAGLVKGEKGYLIEIAGFASAGGDETYNRRLSQKRADAVIQHLAEQYSIPLRRFVPPMGYGESQPTADNKTRTGRKENRRVEVRILVSKGLTTTENVLTSSQLQ